MANRTRRVSPEPAWETAKSKRCSLCNEVKPIDSPDAIRRVLDYLERG